MHEYTIDSGERRYVTITLAVLGVLAAYGLAQCLDWIELSVPWWLDAPAAVGFAGAFYTIFDNWLWRWGLLAKLAIVKTPRLDGRWQARIGSYGAEQSQAVDAGMEIRQSWTRICVTMTGVHSRSFSMVAAITVESPEPELVYAYQNIPNADAVETMVPHFGTASHRLSSDGTTLNGEYYTGRGRMTFGTLHLERVGRTT